MERMMKDISGTSSQSGAPDQAQELVFQAWETADPVERITLARQALEVSPDCADAWGLLAEEAATTLDEALAYYQNGVTAGERALGIEIFEQDRGHFWGLLETRPYMRARLGLANCLWLNGEREEAMSHYRALLELNPNDNQGVRYLLLACLVEMRRGDEAQALIQVYSEDASAVWCYSRALLAFRGEGNTGQSRHYRAEAVESNKYIPAYLAGRRKLPKVPPDYVGMGDKNEAVSYVFDNRSAWLDTPGAIPWLLKQAK